MLKYGEVKEYPKIEGISKLEAMLKAIKIKIF
jgi:hypothetical protein